MSLCRPSRCGCTLTSSTLQIAALTGGVGYNLETYDGVATEDPDTLPAPGERFEGMKVWLTDTKRLVVWDDDEAAWMVLAEPWQRQASTPTNTTLGTGGTSEVRYQRTYRSIVVKGSLLFGSGGSFTGDPLWTMPYPSVNAVPAFTGFFQGGRATYFDSSAGLRIPMNVFMGMPSTDLIFRHQGSGGTIAPTNPITWTNADQVEFEIQYAIEGHL